MEGDGCGRGGEGGVWASLRRTPLAVLASVDRSRLVVGGAGSDDRSSHSATRMARRALTWYMDGTRAGNAAMAAAAASGEAQWDGSSLCQWSRGMCFRT